MDPLNDSSLPFECPSAPFTGRDVCRAFESRSPRLLSASGLRESAVAMILREDSDGPEVLFIERARHDGDPWSGNLGFPGGKVEKEDGDPRRTAERETLEEIGLDLSGALCLGRLDDITGAHLPVLISCFVFQLSASPVFKLSREIERAFWVPLHVLCDPRLHVEIAVQFRDERMVRPAVNVLGTGQTPLWGITYRLITQFFRILLENRSDHPR